SSGGARRTNGGRRAMDDTPCTPGRRTRALALTFLVFSTAAIAAQPCPHSDHWAADGQFVVGQRTLTLVDTTRGTPGGASRPAKPDRTLVTEVWYPAAIPVDGDPRDAPIWPFATFPLVVMSHSFTGTRLDEAYVARHLASRGFVVAAADFP